MKSTLVLFLFFTMFCFNSYSQSTKCLKKIKTGKFEYTASGVTIEVIRTKNKQIETFNNGSSKIINHLKWISDSEYILTFDEEINAAGCLKKGDKMKMTILKCDGKQYTVKATSESCGSAEVDVSIVSK